MEHTHLVKGLDYALLQKVSAVDACCRMSSADTLNILKWTNLATRRSVHTCRCILVFKCLNNLVPDYLCEYFTGNGNIHNYNTRQMHDLHLPKCQLGKKTLGFYVLGILMHFRLKSKCTITNKLQEPDQDPF